MTNTSETAAPEINAAIHKKLAIDLFNATWDLIDKQDRTAEENDAMIHRAHASYYHWSQVGQPTHLAVGVWQVAHVYTILQQCESAVYHASRNLDICRTHGIGDWQLAFAYEALARAYAAAGEAERSRHYRAEATEHGAKIAEQGERDHFQAEFAKGPWFGIDL
jgi:hypothetical protein